MNKQIYEQLIEGRDGIILNENNLVQYVADIYWDEVHNKNKKQGHLILLYNKFYNNCLKALKQQSITDNDLIKFEVLSTIINAINNTQDTDLNSLNITRYELEEVKNGAKELIVELKGKYEKKIITDYEETFGCYKESVLTKIAEDIRDMFFDQILVKLNEDNYSYLDEDKNSYIEELILDSVVSENYKKLIDLCATKDNIEEVKMTINEICENATNKEFEDLDEEAKTLLSMADFSSVDEELIQIIRNNLKLEKLRNYCKTESELKIADCIIELKERIAKNIKDTAILRRSGDALFRTGYSGIDFDLSDFMQITEEKIGARMDPEDILAEVQAINGKHGFKGIVYDKDDAILAILRKYMDNNGYCGDDSVGYTGQPAIRRKRR